MVDDKPIPPKQYLGVMVSSTFSDLKKHRAKLMKAIDGQGLHAVAMEQDAALPGGTVIDSSLGKVRDAAAYVGVISRRYGQVPEDDGLNSEGPSLTQLDFREARRLGRPILIFIMSSEHPVVEAGVELDPDKRSKLEAFREEVKRASEGSTVHRVYKEFDSLQGFAEAATQSVAELRRQLDEHKEANESRGRSSNDPAKALQVVIEQANWIPFNHVALILEMRVSVVNNTNKRKRLTSFQLYSSGQVTNGFEDPEVSRKVADREQEHNLLTRTSVLEPGETLTGWMVYALPWKTTAGEPEYTFIVFDELKNPYEAAKA